jgi:hypothetical protein
LVDILEAYGLLLSKDWSQKLQVYFASDCLWLLWNGKPNKITIDQEKCMKHTITNLEVISKPSSFEFPILGNYSFDLDVGNFITLSSEIPKTKRSTLVLQDDVCNVPIPHPGHVTAKMTQLKFLIPNLYAEVTHSMTFKLMQLSMLLKNVIATTITVHNRN